MFFSTVAMRPAGAEGELEVGAKGGTAANGVAAVGVPGLVPLGAPAKGQGRGSHRRPLSAAAATTTHINELEAQFTKERTFSGMVFLLSIANCTVKIAFQGATSTGSHIVGSYVANRSNGL